MQWARAKCIRAQLPGANLTGAPFFGAPEARRQPSPAQVQRLCR